MHTLTTAPPSSPQVVKPGLVALYADPPAKIIKGDVSGRTYGGRSFGCLRPYHLPRRLAIHALESCCFEPFILTVILANLLTMAWASPLDPPGTWKADFLERIEPIYLYIYTVELALKTIAYGLTGTPSPYLHDPWCLLHACAHHGAHLPTGTPSPYLKDPWCLLDALVVSVAWLPLLTPLTLANMSFVRTLRALRPLRALRSLPDMPALVESILFALPKLGNIVGLCAFTFLLFGIVGAQLFGGALHYRCASAGFDAAAAAALIQCGWTRESPRKLDECGWTAVEQAAFDTEVACNPEMPSACDDLAAEALGAGEGSGGIDGCRLFEASMSGGLLSFDSVPLAQIILMQIITFDDWATSMYALMASVSPWVVVYYMAALIIGGFFITNLFLAVLFDEFLTVKRIDKATEAMIGGARAPAQVPAPANSAEMSAEMASTKAKSVRKGMGGKGGGNGGEADALLEASAARSDGLDPPPIPPSRWVEAFHSAAVSSWLSTASTALVLLNMALMAVPYYGMAPAFAELLEEAITTITLLFSAEMGIKLLGLGCHGYWSDGWNTLDGTLVTMSLAELLIMEIVGDLKVPNLSFLRVLRMLRILRILRLMKSWEGLYKVVMAFGRALSQMGALATLMLLMLSVFSLIGMQLFGGMYSAEHGYSADPCPAGECTDPELLEKPYYHFDYFGPAMLTVLCVATGAWTDGMLASSDVYGPVVVLYFVPVALIGVFLLLNLFVGVLLNAFGEEEEPAASSDEPNASDETPASDENPAEEAQPNEHSHSQPNAASSSAIAAAGAVSGASKKRGSSPDTAPPALQPAVWPRDYSCLLCSPTNPVRPGLRRSSSVLPLMDCVPHQLSPCDGLPASLNSCLTLMASLTLTVPSSRRAPVSAIDIHR